MPITINFNMKCIKSLLMVLKPVKVKISEYKYKSIENKNNQGYYNNNLKVKKYHYTYLFEKIRFKRGER